jgi:site-specific recombinase XerD
MNALATLAPSLPAALQTAVREAVAASTAHNTERAYRADARAFVAFAEQQGLAAMPAAPATVAAFLTAEAEAGKAVATVRRRAASIAAWHRRQGEANPCASELVKATLRGLARQRGTDQRQAAALTRTDAAVIRSRLGDGVKDCRDLALILCGRDLLSRSSELVALDVSAVAFEDDGATVALRRIKTSTEAGTFWLGREAAEALRAWLTQAGITEGAIFRSITKGGRVTSRRLTTRDIGRILKDRAKQARLQHAEGISGHSLRVGMAVDLAVSHIDLASLMQAGSWKSPVMAARYTRKISAKRGAVAQYYARLGI